MLSKESVEEFQQIYKKVYGKEISFAEAEKQGEALLNLVSAVAGSPLPLTKSEAYDAE